MNTTNNTILITGGTSGIGLALVKRFHQLGNRLLVVSGNQQNLDQLSSDLPDITTIKCDLSRITEVDGLIGQCLENHQDINLLINNAGVQYNYQWIQEAYPNPLIEKEMRINLLSPLQLVQGLLPLLKDKPQAAIINVSSVLAVVPKQSAPIYCASKAGLHIFSQTLRYQLESTNIKVFEVLPPLVDTPMTAGRGTNKLSPERLVEEFMKNFAKDRFEMNIGKTKLLRSLKRLAPGMADGILRNN